MNGFSGADIEQVEALARRLEQASNRLEALTSKASMSLMTAAWTGADIDQVRSNWNSRTKPNMVAAARSLDGLSVELKRQAEQQRAASGGGSGLSGLASSLGEFVNSTARSAADAIRDLADGGIELPGGPKLNVDDDGFTISDKDKVGDVWGLHDKAEGEFKNDLFSGSGSAEYLLGAEASAERSWEIGPDGLKVGVGAQASAGAGASAEGEVSFLGLATAGGKAEVFAGARASADASATVGPDGVSVKAGVNAFAGAEASAEANVNVVGVDVGAKATAYAGIGVKANVAASVTMEEVSVSLDLGVALGVGAGVKVDLSFKPVEAAKNIINFFGF